MVKPIHLINRVESDTNSGPLDLLRVKPRFKCEKPL